MNAGARAVAAADPLLKPHFAAIEARRNIVENTGNDPSAQIDVIEDEIFRRLEF